MVEYSALMGGSFLSAAIGAGATAIATATAKLFFDWKAAKEARKLADEEAFQAALQSADLNTLGLMLRDKFGSVSLPSLLDDKLTQDRVLRSLEKLNELVNQPTPDIESDEPKDEKSTSKRSENKANDSGLKYTVPKYPPIDGWSYEGLSKDFRIGAAMKIADIAQQAEDQLSSGEVWTALAGARRGLEMALSPSNEDRRRRPLSYKWFATPKLRNAMGIFLRVANRAIHGEETSQEEALSAIRALRFISRELPS